MNILYIVARPIEINASSSIRNAATIKGVIENGNKVDVLSAEPDSNHQGYDLSLHISGANYLYKKAGGIHSAISFSRRIYVPTFFKKAVASYLSRSTIYDSFSGMADKVNEWNIDLNKYDCIISSSDPKSSHLIALRLKEVAGNTKVRWIQIWGDPFMDDISIKRSPKMKKKVEREERRLLNSADKIIYVSKMTLETQMRFYSECKRKMFFLPPPYLTERISKEESLNTDEVRLVYCGDYNNRVRNIIPLIDCVKRSKKLHLTVCGAGDVDISDGKNVEVHDRAPREKVLEMEAGADVLIHICNRRGTQIPGKIYQYAGTDKRILFILDGECERIKEMFEVYQRFVFCKNNAGSIAEALSDIMGKNKNIKLRPLEEFSPRLIAGQILD